MRGDTEVWIALLVLPMSERDRVGRMAYQQPEVDFATAPSASIPEELHDLVAAWRESNSFRNRAFAVTNPADIDFNSPEAQAAELPASNGIGTARGLARMYAALIGEVDSVRLFMPETVASVAREQSCGTDRVTLIPSRFGSGYMLPTDTNPMTGPTAFGHAGRGGSLAFADPEHGIALGYYVMNHSIEDPDDTLAASLVEAVRASLT